jgi:hypothetical protein
MTSKVRRLRAVERTDPTMATVTVVDADSAAPGEPIPAWQEMATEVGQILTALAGYNIDLRDTIDPRQMRPRIESFSACRMLVLKGICTEEEMHTMQIEAHRDLLRGILQAAENQRMQQQTDMRKPVVVDKPGLVIAKH